MYDEHSTLIGITGAVVTMLVSFAISFYIWIEFIKLCNWLGQFTWP